jgi:hypothetical protein
MLIALNDCYHVCLERSKPSVNSEGRLEGVDRRKLKFTTLNTLQAGVSVRIKSESGREVSAFRPRGVPGPTSKFVAARPSPDGLARDGTQGGKRGSCYPTPGEVCS